MESEVVEYVGVYDADGGLAGEARYIIGKFLGTTHCALCDITHSPVRRKPEWDRMVARLGVPFTLLHRNELDAELRAAVAASGTPVVLARDRAGSLQVVLRATDMETMGGSVPALAAALDRRT